MSGPLVRAPTPASHWSLIEPPPRDWLVDGLIPMGCVTLLIGDGGLGKGTLMLQLGVAVTAGGDWLGRPVRAGRALIIQAEDDEDEIGRRLRSIACASEANLTDDLETISQDHLPDSLALFREVDGRLAPTRLFEWIEQRIREVQPALFVLDPLADFFEGDHNARAEVTRFVRRLAQLARQTGTAIVLIDHPSVEGMRSGRGTSGSTGWSLKVRSRLYLSKDKNGLCLDHRKTNYGPMSPPIRLHYDRGRFAVEDGEQNLAPWPPYQDASPDPAQAVFLDLVAEEIAQGNRLSDHPGKNYAPAVLARRSGARGFTKKRFETIMKCLIGDGALKVEMGGPPTKRHRLLTINRLPTSSNPPTNADIQTSNAFANATANGVPTPSNAPTNALPTACLPPPPHPPCRENRPWRGNASPVPEQTSGGTEMTADPNLEGEGGSSRPAAEPVIPPHQRRRAM